MSNSVKFRRHLVKIFWITIGWTSVSLYQFFSGYNTIQDPTFKCDLSGIELGTFLKGTLITGLTAGILGGTVVVVIWEKWLRSKSYGWALFSMLWSYSLIYFFVALIGELFFQTSFLELPIGDIRVWKTAFEQIFYIGNLSNYLFWLVIILGTLLILQVNDKYGPGVFAQFLKGRYFNPQKEERIFMFLDLRSSTTIAEKLGDSQYFKFLSDVFKFSTPPILNSKGEIYQYVGDEIVISWKTSKGTENANCLNCFFSIKQELSTKNDYFIKTYGIIPEFKAGLHYGEVVVGEIGVVKREIAYSGDVLNTTSRIQSQCNSFGVNILLSEILLNKLSLKSKNFITKMMGDILLRGKEQSIALYTVGGF